MFLPEILKCITFIQIKLEKNRNYSTLKETVIFGSYEGYFILPNLPHSFQQIGQKMTYQINGMIVKSNYG